jgi:signal transduction histidine kinase
MKALQSLSFRGQITVLLGMASVVTLAVTILALLVSDLWRIDLRIRREASAVAESIAASSRAAVLSEDPEAAQEALAAVNMPPRIEHARILAASGRVLAEYHSPLVSPGRLVKASLEVVDRDRRIGTVLVARSGPTAASRLRYYGQVGFPVLLVSLVISAVAAVVLSALAGRSVHDLPAGSGAVRPAAGPRDSPETSGMVELNRELLASKQKAEESARLKGEFLANMSHEVRTPIQGIIGMTDLALDGAVDADQREYLVAIKWSANSLLGIVNEILDFSKIEAGKIVLEEVDFSLRAELAELTRPFSLRAKSQGLDMIVTVDDDVPDRRFGDVMRLRQTLVNLIGNALKFTKAGSIRVTVSRLEPQGLRFSVCDTGVGIDPAKREQIFRPFVQADGSTTRRYGGTGLGLAICAKFVELMGGSITVESQPGVGSQFRFTVPLRQASGSTDSSPNPPAQSPAPMKQPAGPGSGARILVAEDNPVNQRVIEKMLTKRGYHVRIACSGREAVEVWADWRPELILMDLQMPEMDGLEATATIRARGGDRVPIIALTANAMKGDRERCLAGGMDGYVSKPIHVDRLEEALSEAFSARVS